MKKIIFFSYDGLLDPLGQSQVIPYIKHLKKKGYIFSIISYEKKIINSLNKNEFLNNIKWYQIKFSKGFASQFINILKGVIRLRKAIHNEKPDLIHLRGFIPSLIFFLSYVNLKYLYDFRSFAVGEHVDTGNLKENGFLHYIFKKIDHRLIKKSSGIVVLEEPAKNLLIKTYDVPNIPIKIIRTCTDPNIYKVKKNYIYQDTKEIKFVSLGGARKPYRSDLMIKIVKDLLDMKINCSIDFINEFDHEIISYNFEKILFPKSKIKIYKMKHKNIIDHLNQFDFGLIFYDTTKWRRVCSPTKLGEFLSAGLPIIALEGIDIVDMYSNETSIIHTINKKELNNNLYQKKLIPFLQKNHSNHICQDLAKKDFNINNANIEYEKIYKEILF